MLTIILITLKMITSLIWFAVLKVAMNITNEEQQMIAPTTYHKTCLTETSSSLELGNINFVCLTH